MLICGIDLIKTNCKVFPKFSHVSELFTIPSSSEAGLDKYEADLRRIGRRDCRQNQPKFPKIQFFDTANKMINFLIYAESINS